MRSGGGRRRRIARWVGVGLLATAGLVAALDVVAVQYLSSRGASQIVRTMSAEEASADMGGFPFLPGFLRGRLGGVEVSVRGATASGGLRVQSLDVRLPDVRFSPRDVFALARSSFAVRTEVRAIQPIGTVELAQADLEEFIKRQIPLVEEVRITSSGVEVGFDPEVATPPPPQEGEEDAPSQPQPARFLPRLEEGRLVLSLVSVGSLRPALRQEAERIETLIRLPQIPGGLRGSVRLGDGVIVVEAEGAEGEEVRVMVGEGEPRG